MHNYSSFDFGIDLLALLLHIAEVVHDDKAGVVTGILGGIDVTAL